MSNPNFNPQHSTNDIWRDSDDTRCLTDDLDAMDVLIAGKAEVNHTHTGYASTSHEHDGYAPIIHEHSGYANINHAHSEYVSQSDLELIEDVIDTKADTSHTHSEYASSSHTHSDYVTVTALNTLETEIDGKASVNHAHSEYAEASHSHANYAEVNHAHDEDYAAIAHTHDNYATVSALNEVSIAVSDKADASHSHNNVYYTETEIDTKLAEKSDSTHTHTGVYDVSGSAANALTSAKSYTDSEIDSLSDIVADKANSTDLTSHTGNTTVHITSTERNNWNAAKSHASSAHAPTNAEENQNAFSNIVIGNTTISADTKTDTLTLVAGNNITLAPDTTGDSITISSANTVYTHPTSAGNKHIPAGGSSGQILRWSANGTAVWGNDNNTTYSEATQTTSGLMSDIDKVKLDGIASGANAYTLPTASSTLGGVKTTSTVTSNSGYTACPIISGVPYYKDTNTTYNLGSFGVTATAAEINTLDGITATTSELNYCDGVTSNIQTQLNNKHTKGDNITVEKSGSTPYASLKVKDTSLETRIYKNANTTNDYGTIIQDYSSDGKRDALILRRNTSLDNKLTLKVQNTDGTDVNYQIYGQHTPNLMSSNENGNCVIGWDNYDAGSGDTNIYGENVHIYARNADGSLPAGAVFVGRNSNNHTLINNAAHLDTENISDTYIYGRAVHIDTNDTNFIVDSIQLAHTDKASISSYSSGWTYYGTASANTPTVRRYGKVVSLTGALTNTSAVTLNTTHVKVFTIPSGYRPSQDIIVLCQGSGANEFCLQIKTDGSVYIGRYGTSSFSSIATGQWFPFHVSWVIE